MKLDDLLAEAHRLAKPCREYRFAKKNEPVGGYWHGVEEGRLCASIERGGLWLNVHLDEDRSGRVAIAAEPTPSKRPLHRRDGLSLPPVDALFRFGSREVQQYIEAHGWKRDWPFNGNFKGAAAHQYERAWSRQCPLYGDGIVVVEGGWNVPWPDGDWDELLGQELMLWTFEESEPWVEVFWDGDDYTVFQRGT